MSVDVCEDFLRWYHDDPWEDEVYNLLMRSVDKYLELRSNPEKSLESEIDFSKYNITPTKVFSRGMQIENWEPRFPEMRKRNPGPMMLPIDFNVNRRR